MKFYAKIVTARYEERFKPKRTTIYAEYFKAPSLQAAKAKLTRIANQTELFSWVQSWDNEKRIYTGKELRWAAWKDLPPYTQDNGVEIAWSERASNRVSGERIYADKNDKWGRGIDYTVTLSIYCSKKTLEKQLDK